MFWFGNVGIIYENKITCANLGSSTGNLEILFSSDQSAVDVSCADILIAC